MLKFNRNYFILTVLLFLIEVCIALFVHDKIIRPYVGDFLVVILIYCFIKSFFNLSNKVAAISTLIFSYAVEALQYFNVVTILGLQHSKPARIIIGASFSWEDIVAYTAGIGLVFLTEKLALRLNKSHSDRNF